MPDFDVCACHTGGLPPIPYQDALRRVQAYMAAEGTGWATYDLPGIHARRAGYFATVGPWSLLPVIALSGRVAQKQVAAFTHDRRQEFAKRVASVPDQVPLAEMTDDQLAAVVHLTSFGFKGAWGPTITKLAALYRPEAVPVLDSQIACAFGLAPDAFTKGKQWKVHIEAVVRQIAEWHRRPENRELLRHVRVESGELVDEVALVSDVRLLDIILWTSQDDVSSRRRAKRKRWVDIDVTEARQTLASAEAVPLPRSGEIGNRG